MVDIKEKINDIVEKIKDNPDIKEQFEKDPVKAIEKLIGVDLPDDVIEKVIDGVKVKLTADKIGDIAGKFKKLF